MRLTRVIYAATAVALVAASLTATGAVAAPRTTAPTLVRPSANLTGFYKQHIVWTKCPGYSSVKCTWIKVPLDYGKTNGDTLRLRVALHPASVSAHNLGDLFTNPGGPGGGGIDVAENATQYLPSEITQHYNVVGIDPRGVGMSNPIHCLTTAGLDSLNGFGPNPVNSTPTTLADIAKWDAFTKAFGAACKARNPKLFDHIGTQNAARDMDVVRVVLGQNKLTYYGWSYGTYLGAWYAQLFPKHVARFVLDGAIDPSLDNMTSSYNQLKAFENELHRFLTDCPNHQNCPKKLSGTGAQNFATFQKLSASLTLVEPKQTQPGLPNTGYPQFLTQNLFLTAVIGMMYSDTFGWDLLRQALANLLDTSNPNGQLMLQLAYFEDGKDPNTLQYQDNLAEAFNAISCYDYPAPPNISNMSNDIAGTWAQQFPAFGQSFAWGQQICAQWPAHSSVRPQQLHAKGSGPILVVGTKYDPATPYAGAVSLSKQLQNGHLLTWIGDGHTAYNRGSACIDGYITKYLLSGKLPPKGKVCPAVRRP